MSEGPLLDRTRRLGRILNRCSRRNDRQHGRAWKNRGFPKIDVEGADTWVLVGCERLLADKSVRTIHFEQNKPRLRQLGIKEVDAERYLSKRGYLARPVSDPSADVVDWIAEPRDGAA